MLSVWFGRRKRKAKRHRELDRKRSSSTYLGRTTMLKPNERRVSDVGPLVRRDIKPNYFSWDVTQSHVRQFRLPDLSKPTATRDNYFGSHRQTGKITIS